MYTATSIPPPSAGYSSLDLVTTFFKVIKGIEDPIFPEALKLLEDVKKTAPQLSASYEIEAGVYFLQNKKTEALDSYRAAAQLNPKSNEAIRMRDMIEAELMRSSGGRLPASTKAGAQ